MTLFVLLNETRSFKTMNDDVVVVDDTRCIAGCVLEAFPEFSTGFCHVFLSVVLLWVLPRTCFCVGVCKIGDSCIKEFSN